MIALIDRLIIMSIVSNNGDDDDSNFFGGLSISSLVSDDYQNDTKGNLRHFNDVYNDYHYSH